MAQLSPLIQFTAGTPAVAADVNSNFNDIRNHINGANVDTENIAATLTSRAGGPILFLNQASQNQIALSVQNSQTNTAVQILQSAVLADATKAVLKIDSPTTQTTGKAELWLDLAAGSTIPAILVEHGADVTMSLTKTQLNLFNGSTQITSSNISTTSLITITSPLADAIALRLAGRSSDNLSVLDFTNNTKTTQYANLKGSATSLNYNVQTGSSHNFLVNDVIKGKIDNDGVDGQYIKNTSIPKGKMVNVGQVSVSPPYFTQTASGGNPNQTVGPTVIPGSSVTLTSTGRPVMVCLDGYIECNNNGSGAGYLRLILYLYRGATNIATYDYINLAGAVGSGGRELRTALGKVHFDAVSAGTHTYSLQLYALSATPIGGGPLTVNMYANNLRILVYEL